LLVFSIRQDPYGWRVELRLAGLAEVAELLGVSRRTASRYTTRPDFPSPVSRLRSGPVWLEKDVRAWAQDGPSSEEGHRRFRVDADDPDGTGAPTRLGECHGVWPGDAIVVTAASFFLDENLALMSESDTEI
jgi:predicted DNA-binding transcriptional regulator AlpA